MKTLPAFLLIIIVVSCFSFLFFTPTVAQSSTAKVSLDPVDIMVGSVNEEFEVKILISDVQKLWMWTVIVTWDQSALSLVGDPQEGAFFKTGVTTIFQPVLAVPGVTPDVTELYLSISDVFLSNDYVSGSGVLAILKFKVLKTTVDSPIYIKSVELLGPNTSNDPTSPVNPTIAHVIQSPALVSLIPEGSIVANAGLPQTVDEGVPAVLNASKTFPKSDALNFTWTFFDGEEKILTGKLVNYTFEYPGVYNVTLRVSNAEGKESIAETVITVNDTTQPIAKITYETGYPGKTVYAGKEASFSGRDSYDPENGTLDEKGYLWDFGDGSEFATHRETSHTYLHSGTYTVTFSVRDSRGNLTGTDTVKLEVHTYSGVDPTSEGGVIQQGALPPMVLGVIIAVTVVTIIGSAFWLLGSKKMP